MSIKKRHKSKMNRKKRREKNRKISETLTEFNDDTINRLKEAFLIDANVVQACKYANISTVTYYKWIKKRPELFNIFDACKNDLAFKAKYVIAGRIKAEDADMAKWLLARKEKGYEDKLKIDDTEDENSILGDEIHPEDEELRKEYRDKLNENIRKRWEEKKGQSLKETKE